MLRVFLASILMAIVALPQGMCVCHFLHAGPPQSEHCCNEEHPSPGTPTDDSDEHEDCDCTLREVLAWSSSNVYPERDGTPTFDYFVSPRSTSASISIALFSPTNGANSSDGPIPLILCALRI